MMMSLSATRGEASANAEGNWTEYMKAFSGKLFRPDPTALDADPEPAATPENPGESAPSPRSNIAIKNPLFESRPDQEAVSRNCRIFGAFGRSGAQSVVRLTDTACGGLASDPMDANPPQAGVVKRVGHVDNSPRIQQFQPTGVD